MVKNGTLEATSKAALLTIAVPDPTFTLDGCTYEVIENTMNVFVKSFDDGNVSSVTIPAQVVFNDKTYNVTEIGEAAFENNTKITAVSLPNSIQVIHARAFKNCSNLSTMTTHD